MLLRSVLALSLSISPSISAAPQFCSNVNYRITAILDVNGGASEGPNFQSVADDSKVAKTPGYSVPIEVLTLQDSTGKWRQRISYYSGIQVDYNVNGEGYKVISTPYTGKSDESSDNTCFYTGGNSTDAKEKVGYLNFFPTLEQMQHYTLGKLVTTEAGIPYRIATLEAPHGSYNATSKTTLPDASYDTNTGMPTMDWFQLHYEEGLTIKDKFSRPLKWTMLARNQIINSHTEDWVLRYLSYEAIDTDDERKLWESWFDLKLKGDCGKDNKIDHSTLLTNGSHKKLNRLGMFFSTTSSLHSVLSATPPTDPSHFDLFLARNNKHYTNPQEYHKRKMIHDTNVKNIEQWNSEHSGKTKFAANEFMDMQVREVMEIRGGHVPRRKHKRKRDGEKKGNNLRQTGLLGDGTDDDDDNFTPYVVPKDFDPSTLPESFDWRYHLPGSVGPIKDQGFCGS